MSDDAMVLHLLGKKSWNVYNNDNIERVRRDEAAAAAREEAEEQVMQEEDARRRMRLLRGEPVEEEPTVVPRLPRPVSRAEERLGLDITYGDRDRKRKRMRGEDDTDRDIRHAKRMFEDQVETNEKRIVRAGRTQDDASLIDQAGNINLFPAEQSSGHDRDRRESELKKSRREREQNESPVPRLSDAAGRSRHSDATPWYLASQSQAAGEREIEEERVRKDVWGNEDPRRKNRDQARIATDDPLAFMKKGVQQVRKVEADRKRWKAERDAEMASMREDEKRRRQRHARRGRMERDGSEYDLDTISLDADPSADSSRRKHQHRSHHEHRRHSESRRENSRYKHRS